MARFGVGYDSVDVEALADAGVATTITPGGVQRPVAVAILALILALSNKLLAKDRLARRGADGFADPSAPIGMGLTGKTTGDHRARQYRDATWFASCSHWGSTSSRMIRW